ncbi:MAG: hypothetical protein ACWA6Y_12905 [Polaromonas sp.]
MAPPRAFTHGQVSFDALGSCRPDFDFSTDIQAVSKRFPIDKPKFMEIIQVAIVAFKNTPSTAQVIDLIE